MIQIFPLSPGVTLRCYSDHRFKQGRLSIQFVRPMCREEAAMNALLPAVLLRGSAVHPDLRAITMYLDHLYGATAGDLVRRVGDYQTTGLICSFTDDRFALPGDRIWEPLAAFVKELLLQPLLEDGHFSGDIVESEKKNRIADIESEFNDKRVYAANCLIRIMCRGDSSGIPRLGSKEDVEAITAEGLFQHYRRILAESPIEIFYVGSMPPQEVARQFSDFPQGIHRQVSPLPPQTPFADLGGRHDRQESISSQSLLNMGFVTNVTLGHRDYAAMRVLNLIFGGGQTCKLFQNIREKQSLCYAIGSDYSAAKGMITVSAGIDAHQEEPVRREILAQLEAIRQGEISREELDAAKEALLSALQSITDSTGAMEAYFSSQALLPETPSVEDYRNAVQAVEIADVVRAAQTIRLHSSFFLQGVGV